MSLGLAQARPLASCTPPKLRRLQRSMPPCVLRNPFVFRCVPPCRLVQQTVEVHVSRIRTVYLTDYWIICYTYQCDFCNTLKLLLCCMSSSPASTFFWVSSPTWSCSKYSHAHKIGNGSTVLLNFELELPTKKEYTCITQYRQSKVRTKMCQIYASAPKSIVHRCVCMCEL